MRCRTVRPSMGTRSLKVSGTHRTHFSTSFLITKKIRRRQGTKHVTVTPKTRIPSGVNGIGNCYGPKGSYARFWPALHLFRIYLPGRKGLWHQDNQRPQRQPVWAARTATNLKAIVGSAKAGEFKPKSVAFVGAHTQESR